MTRGGPRVYTDRACELRTRREEGAWRTRIYRIDSATIRRGRDRLIAFVALLGSSRATYAVTRAEQFEASFAGFLASLLKTDKRLEPNELDRRC